MASMAMGKGSLRGEEAGGGVKRTEQEPEVRVCGWAGSAAATRRVARAQAAQRARRRSVVARWMKVWRRLAAVVMSVGGGRGS